jgi:hypothetical protein
LKDILVEGDIRLGRRLKMRLVTAMEVIVNIQVYLESAFPER